MGRAGLGASFWSGKPPGSSPLFSVSASSSCIEDRTLNRKASSGGAGGGNLRLITPLISYAFQFQMDLFSEFQKQMNDWRRSKLPLYGVFQCVPMLLVLQCAGSCVFLAWLSSQTVGCVINASRTDERLFFWLRTEVKTMPLSALFSCGYYKARETKLISPIFIVRTRLKKQISFQMSQKEERNTTSSTDSNAAFDGSSSQNPRPSDLGAPLTSSVPPTAKDELMFRRRDKRRHVSSKSMDVRDPYSIINLAIRYDEALATKQLQQAPNDIKPPRTTNTKTSQSDTTRATTSKESGTISVLEVPLETGSIYNQKAFAQALKTLEQASHSDRQAPNPDQSTDSQHHQGSHTDHSGDTHHPQTEPQTSNPHKSTQKQKRQQLDAPLTPIILSGLVSSLQERNHKDDSETPSAVDLVAYCRSMRRAALTRVKNRHYRRQVQQHCTPLILFAILILLVLWSAASARSILVEYQFTTDDDDNESDCNSLACRFASVHVWEFTSPSHPTHLVPSDCTLHECPIIGEEPWRLVENPTSYALHTSTRPVFLSIHEWEYPRKFSPKVWPRSSHKSPLHGINLDGSRSQSASKSTELLSPLQWLGETTVNRLVREAIHNYHPPSIPIKILDCGCGVGGTLYSLLNFASSFSAPSTQSSTSSSSRNQQRHKRKISYHGIALARPEVYLARALLARHRVVPTETTSTSSASDADVSPFPIHFQQHDFDDPLNIGSDGQSYSTMIAIESLSYSRKLPRSLKNLVSSLQGRGIFIVVDDVLAPWTTPERRAELRQATGKTSLRTHQEWTEIFHSKSLAIKEVRDLSLVMDLDEVFRDSVPRSNLFGFLSDLRYFVSQFAANRWSAWFGEGKTAEQRASLRMIRLVQDIIDSSRADAARELGYQSADLSYYMYVLVKN